MDESIPGWNELGATLFLEHPSSEWRNDRTLLPVTLSLPPKNRLRYYANRVRYCIQIPREFIFSLAECRGIAHGKVRRLALAAS